MQQGLALPKRGENTHFASLVIDDNNERVVAWAGNSEGAMADVGNVGAQVLARLSFNDAHDVSDKTISNMRRDEP